jgi:hypothetical protein
MNTSFLFQRFALSIFHSYALMFHQPEYAIADPSFARTRAALCQVLLASVCITFLGVRAKHAMDLATESADFQAVLATIEPAQRALTLVFDKNSPAARNPAI